MNTNIKILVTTVMTHRQKNGGDSFVMMYTTKQRLKSYNTFKK